MNILFTAGGRRVEILEIFKRELPEDKVFVADVTNTAPALYYADEYFIIPNFSKEDCLGILLALCVKKEINIIIPLIDPEIDFYSKRKGYFLEKGIWVMLSDEETVKICRNKWATFKFFKKHNIPVAKTFSDKKEILNFPVIAKPIFGSAGKGVFLVKNRKNMEVNQFPQKQYIYQEFIQGEEITVDVIGDGKGNLLAACQRKRLKVRGGEVERAVTMFDEKIDSYVKKIVAWLKPFGPINIQVYRNNRGELFFQEINLRLGGGVPLAYRAGINIPKIIKGLIVQDISVFDIPRPKEGLYMLRYDQAVYLNREELIDIF